MEKICDLVYGDQKCRTDVHQARMAPNTEYTLDEWLKQQDSTRKDCISCAGAMLPMTGRSLGEERRYYRHCDFYKENCFCGVDAGECESRDKNLKYANAVRAKIFGRVK